VSVSGLLLSHTCEPGDFSSAGCFLQGDPVLWIFLEQRPGRGKAGEEAMLSFQATG
jgi:hypothetical protein